MTFTMEEKYCRQNKNMLKIKAIVSMCGNSQALRLPPEMSREMGTIEYLFKDYSGENFKTELTNPVEPIGEEKW